jgi:hypothetical protein
MLQTARSLPAMTTTRRAQLSKLAGYAMDQRIWISAHGAVHSMHEEETPLEAELPAAARGGNPGGVRTAGGRRPADAVPPLLVLRQAGAAYQFGHVDLQRRLATRPAE